MCADIRSHPPADIGRNDPCPCGSGKKYKKCCLARDAAAEAAPSSTAWLDQAARPATMPDAGLNLHPYALVKMVTNPAPELWSQLSKRDVAALKDKWSIAKVASFETPEIVWRLEQLGIDAHPPAFAGLTAGRSSAWSVGEAWVDGMSTPLDQDEDDFICLAACELWKRYWPERPSMEMVDDWVTEGYDLSEAGKEDEAADVWWRAWAHVRSTLQPHMTTLEAADPVFKVTQFFGNWIGDITMTLGNAALRDRKYADMGVEVLRGVLHQFVDEDLNTDLHFRCALGRLLFQAGRIDEGKATLETIIRDYPDRSCGYACLSDELGLAKPDYPRAIALLEQALAHPVVDAADWDVESRLAELRDKVKQLPSGGSTM